VRFKNTTYLRLISSTLSNFNRNLETYIFSSYFIIILFSIAIISRLWFFWQPPFSGDEAIHMLRAVSISRGVFDLITLNQIDVAFQNIYTPILQHNHPLLEYLILIPSVFFEPRELFARLVYVVINLLALTFSYKILKKKFGINASIIFLILAGTSIFLIYWSQSAMYISLAFFGGAFTTISIINFYLRSGKSSLYLLAVSFAASTLIFQDFIFYIPGIIWLLWDKRRKIKLKYICYALLLSVIIAGVFYLPYIIYGVLNWPKNMGFNYVIVSKLSSNVNIFRNIEGYWTNFFGAPGIFVTWPFIILFFRRVLQLGYSKYLLLTLLIYLFVFILRSVTPFLYFVSILGILMILSARVLSSIKYRALIVTLILIINTIPVLLILKGIHNPFLFTNLARYSQIKQIGILAKKCVIDENETYVSTADAWQAMYYFGRPSLFEEERVEVINNFATNGNELIKFIHFQRGQISEEVQSKLESSALQKTYFNDDIVLIYKNCA